MSRSELLATAAAESRRQVRRDRGAVPASLRPILAAIGRHLFDPGFDVKRLKAICGVRDSDPLSRFTHALGRTPRDYIEDRRCETAARLLVTSELAIWEIAELLGYSRVQVFSRAFTRWCGRRPSRYRRAPPGAAPPASPAPASAEAKERVMALLEEALSILREP